MFLQISVPWTEIQTSEVVLKYIYGFFFSAGPNWSLTLQQFCCKPFPFFHTKWRKFLLLYTQEAMRAIWWKKMFCLFFISKIYSHVTQKWRPKTGMAITYCLCWKLLHTRRKYSDISNLFAKLQHAKAPES